MKIFFIAIRLDLAARFDFANFAKPTEIIRKFPHYQPFKHFTICEYCEVDF
jgi:hypothetical protein